MLKLTMPRETVIEIVEQYVALRFQATTTQCSNTWCLCDDMEIDIPDDSGAALIDEYLRQITDPVDGEPGNAR